ncbi:MAG: DUF1730 domain-containing protein [Clostridia bacterium]|nr:DUF1730 domain-containing protein [Clostridia bacterium]
MKNSILQLLREQGITLCAPLSLEHCRITRPYLLERAGITSGTAFLLAVPYYTTECDDPTRNISSYAVARDYHGFFEELFAALLPRLRAAFPQNRFVGFADHSPIAETEAAARAGLGAIGCNHLLLTEDYGSYVFVGEIITDALLDAPGTAPRRCAACGACRAACPVGLDTAACRSALTQKKGALSEGEQADLLTHGLAWGCDRCQEVCPVNRRAKQRGSIYSPIAFFGEQTRPHLTAAALAAMSEAEFAARAYSWRGRAAILRNLELLEKGEPQ